jgi:O-antigen/teichoic acid export membrane protein
MKELIEKLHLKNVLRLSAATGIGQLLTYGSAPILSRIYNTEDFAWFALFYAWIIPFAVLATLRVEYSIPNAETEMMARERAKLAINNAWRLASVIAIAFSVLYFFGMHISAFEAFLPIGIFTIAAIQTYSFLSTRLNRYRTNALYRVVNSLFINGASIALGYFAFDYLGLVIGFIVGQVISLWVLFNGTRQDELTEEPVKDISLKNFKQYIFFNTPQGIIETLQLSGTVWMLNVCFGDSATGLYFMCWKIIQAPVNLISNTVFLTHYNKASELKNNGESYRPLILSTAKALMLFSGIGAVLIVVLAPTLFAFVFGEEWRASGEMARWLAPFFVLNFSVSPFSFTAILENAQNKALGLNIIDVILKLGALYLGFLMNSVIWAIGLYSLVSSIMYLITFIWYLRLAKNGNE